MYLLYTVFAITAVDDVVIVVIIIIVVVVVIVVEISLNDYVIRLLGRILLNDNVKFKRGHVIRYRGLYFSLY